MLFRSLLVSAGTVRAIQCPRRHAPHPEFACQLRPLAPPGLGSVVLAVTEVPFIIQTSGSRRIAVVRVKHGLSIPKEHARETVPREDPVAVVRTRRGGPTDQPRKDLILRALARASASRLVRRSPREGEGGWMGDGGK